MADSSRGKEKDGKWGSWLAATRRFGFLLFLLYLFLVAIKLLSGSIKILGEAHAEGLFTALENPFAGLAVGVLATVLVQSSSVTTSTIVAMVGSGELSLTSAVPIVFGANIGTSITNTLVSLGHVTRSQEFRRAFAGATVHDVFNLLTVAILLPLELAFHPLERLSQELTSRLPVFAEGAKLNNPVKAVVGWMVDLIEAPLERIGLEGGWLAFALFAIALAMIIMTLVFITRIMRRLMADRIESLLNRALERVGILGIFVGVAITVLVQSSSITTSLLVPMFGAGVLTLEAGFPVMLGANIGTTITALLASSATNLAGLQIAVVHLLFNLIGTLLFFPIRRIRQIPIRLARGLADLAVYNRIWVVVYIGLTFVVLPMIGILIFR